MPHTPPSVDDLLLKLELEQILLWEADLLDAREYDEWLDLFTDDVRYYMPLRRNVSSSHQDQESTRQGTDVCWIDDDKSTLVKRVRQLQTGKHWAEEPVSRSSHLISNVRVIEENEDDVRSACRFLFYRNRQQTETDLLVGRRFDTWRRVDGAWKISSREILLDQNVLLTKTLSLFF